MWYGISLGTVWVSVPGCVPSQYLAHLQERGSGGLWRDVTGAVPALSEETKHWCVINTFLAPSAQHSTGKDAVGKMNFIPAWHKSTGETENCRQRLQLRPVKFMKLQELILVKSVKAKKQWWWQKSRNGRSCVLFITRTEHLPFPFYPHHHRYIDKTPPKYTF